MRFLKNSNIDLIDVSILYDKVFLLVNVDLCSHALVLLQSNAKEYRKRLKQLFCAKIKNNILIPFEKNTKDSKYLDLLKLHIKKYNEK
ncbi:hypothetical protein [Halarcobacter sp.]|uniref:hypothetical protein n=1 Tax=Halarcobacter sp. TaxID=2321133 RepID=UPI003A8E2927